MTIGGEMNEQQTKHEVNVNRTAMATFESRGYTMEHHASQAQRIRAVAAALWAEYDAISIPSGNSEVGRLLAVAKTELETSAMFAIKALTRFAPSKLV